MPHVGKYVCKSEGQKKETLLIIMYCSTTPLLTTTSGIKIYLNIFSTIWKKTEHYKLHKGRIHDRAGICLYNGHSVQLGNLSR